MRRSLPNLRIISAVGIFLCSFAMTNTNAGENTDKSYSPTQCAETFPFVKGAKEFQFMAGPIISFTRDPYRRPSINYISEDLRFGWMLSTPAANSDSWLRGNAELLLEAFGGEVYQGPGSYLAGGTVLLRYNFVQPNTRLYPYGQIGVGALSNDIYKNHNQDLIGQDFEFNLQAAIGVQYLLTPRIAFSLEADYRHISNAGLANRNAGLNSVGGLAGLSVFF